MVHRGFIFFQIFLFFVVPIKAKSQSDGLISGFFKISFPEKIWVITHPFIAKKAWKISRETIRITEEIKKDTLLDGDIDGGQVDAFRHTFWMASLSQKINGRKAGKLGLAHEKTNYKRFKKGIKEDNSLPDAASREMDLLNNDYGIYQGNSNRDLAQNELIFLVKKAVTDGKVWKINKNIKGESLDCKDEVLPKEKYFKKWENQRCLVRSDKKRK